MLSASADVLAFVSSPIPFGVRFASVDRNGEHLRVERDSEAQNWPRLSPDGRRLVRHRLAGRQGNGDLWVEDLERGTRARITTAAEPEIFPVWSPDGGRLAYVVGYPSSSGGKNITIASADGTRVFRTLPCPAEYCEPTDWSPDGRLLFVNVRGPRGSDVWTVPVAGDGAARPLLAESYSERDARISPDGRWLLYVSDEAGRAEVSMRSISGAADRIVISAHGGDQPVWRRDGSEVFFVDSNGRLCSAAIQPAAGGKMSVGLPVELNVPAIGSGHWGTQYDVSPDGRRIYFMRAAEGESPREINVIIGWRALLD